MENSPAGTTMRLENSELLGTMPNAKRDVIIWVANKKKLPKYQQQLAVSLASTSKAKKLCSMLHYARSERMNDYRRKRQKSYSNRIFRRQILAQASETLLASRPASAYNE